MADSSGTSSYAYDEQGRLQTYHPPVGLDSASNMVYSYNNADQKTEVKITNGTSTSYDVVYDYYANSWLKDVKYNGNTVTYYYDSAGNRTGIAYPNGVSVSYAYDTDPRYRLTSITDSGGNMTTLQISYTADSVGNPLSVSDSAGNSTLAWSYRYDANNHLISATPPNPVPGQPAGGAYGYDWMGNRTHPPANPNPMVYNAADQLVRWPGMYGNATSPGYLYDIQGDLTQVNDVSGTKIASYHYNPAGLLDSAGFIDSSGSNSPLANTWDQDSNRVAMSANGQSYSFIYDVTSGIPSVLQENTPSGATYYVRDPDGLLIARYDSTNGMPILSLR